MAPGGMKNGVGKTNDDVTSMDWNSQGHASIFRLLDNNSAEL
jgi:hypothetical protein